MRCSSRSSTMSGPIEISPKYEVAFLKRVLIPSFDVDRNLTTTLARKDWMRERCKEKKWDAELSSELIDMYGMVESLDKAEEKVKEAVALMQQLEHAQSKANLDAETQQRINDSHRMLTALFALQGETTLLDSLSTESDREHNHQQFENEVAINYGRLDTLNHPNQLRCMITNQFHPARLVCKAAHILALSEKKSMPLLGLNKCDIWDPRNGLCILRTIDRRFESKELVYMPIPGHPDAYRVEILYDDLMDEPLGITYGELEGSDDPTPAIFADIQHRPLAFTTPFRPFKRVLLFIAYSAFTGALSNTRRSHTLATAAAPRNLDAWRALFDEAITSGSPPLPATGFIMQRFLNPK